MQENTLCVLITASLSVESPPSIWPLMPGVASFPADELAVAALGSCERCGSGPRSGSRQGCVEDGDVVQRCYHWAPAIVVAVQRGGSSPTSPFARQADGGCRRAGGPCCGPLRR